MSETRITAQGLHEVLSGIDIAPCGLRSVVVQVEALPGAAGFSG